jgi:hypothetical protein
MPDSRFLAIEVKPEKERVALHQQEFIDLINPRGGVAFVARLYAQIGGSGAQKNPLEWKRKKNSRSRISWKPFWPRLKHPNKLGQLKNRTST